MKKILKTSIKFITFFILWALASALIPIPENIKPFVWRLIAELIPFLAIIILTLIYMKFIDKENYDLKIKGNLHNILKSTILGIIWIMGSIGIVLLLKVLKINSFNNVNIILWAIALLLNTIMQELLARGYLYQMIKKKHNLIAAIIITTALFTFMHGGAFEAGPLAVLNVITMSILMTIVLEKYNSILAPIIIHYIWNLIGGLIFGVISLAEDYPSLINTISSGNKIISGGTFKLEGSIIVTIVNILFILSLLTLKKKGLKNEKNNNITNNSNSTITNNSNNAKTNV